MALLAVGIPVLLVWIARRAVYRENLRLLRCPGRPNTVDPLHIVLLLLVWVVSSLAIGQLLAQTVSWPGPPWPAGDSDTDMRTALLTTAASQACWMTATLLVAARTFPLGLSRGLGLSLRHWVFDGLRAVLACLAVWPVCIGLSALCTWLLTPYNLVQQHQMLTGMRRAGPGWGASIVLSAVVLAPLAEELFFRGMLQSMLRRVIGRPWPAVVITSAAFAAVHFSTLQDIPALFVLSLVLGYNYERTGRLTAAVAIHALFNGIAITLMALSLSSGN